MDLDRQRRLERVYTEAAALLELFWGGSSKMIHFGFYPTGNSKDTSHEESLVETVRQVALRLDPQPGEHILDAGCGIGGAAVWLCRTYHVRVDGISNLKLHVDKASHYARQCGLSGPAAACFFQGDYTDSGLPGGQYDGVIAIESVCYAAEPLDVLREAFRLLKPGGRLVVLDGFRTRRNLSPEDERLMVSWLSGWGATDIDTIDEIRGKAISAGFIDVRFEDLQRHFRPSHYQSYRFTRFLCPPARLLNQLGLLSDTLYGHLRSSRDVWLAAERGLCVQGILSARKPG